jgi:hypothetical protein
MLSFIASVNVFSFSAFALDWISYLQILPMSDTVRQVLASVFAGTVHLLSTGLLTIPMTPAVTLTAEAARAVALAPVETVKRIIRMLKRGGGVQPVVEYAENPTAANKEAAVKHVHQITSHLLTVKYDQK